MKEETEKWKEKHINKRRDGKRTNRRETDGKNGKIEEETEKRKNKMYAKCISKRKYTELYKSEN